MLLIVNSYAEGVQRSGFIWYHGDNG